MEPLNARWRIGLTGGIGSGKSTVAAILADLGATLVDTDAIARRLTAPGGAAMPALIASFGRTIATIDGALHREAMRELAFNDNSVRERLESVLHPLIGIEAQAEVEAATTPIVVIDVPLLAESGTWRARADRILVVDCSAATQLDRVAARPGWTREAAAAAIAVQATREARRAIADAVIVNDGIGFERLHTEVESLWSLWNNRRSIDRS